MRFNFFKSKTNKEDIEQIEVEIKIIGMISGSYVNAIFNISLPKDSRLTDLPKEAYEQGKIGKDLFRSIKGIKPPMSIMINGNNAGYDRSQYSLNNGDTITIFTPVSGG